MTARVYKNGPVTTTVIGADEVLADWADIGDRTRQRMRLALTDLAVRLRDKAKSLAPVRSGGPKSIRERIQARLEEKGNSLSGIVYPRAPHSHLLEYGVQEQRVWVKPQERRDKSRDVKGYVKNAQTGKIRRKILTRGVRKVRGYYRNFHVRAHPFMAPAYASMQTEIVARLRRALEEGAVK